MTILVFRLQILSFICLAPHIVYIRWRNCARHSRSRVYFIIGSDNWERFGYWYQSERIIKENQILIYPRPGFPVKEEELLETVRLVHSPVFEISSTFIREALDAGKDVRYFVHPKVWEAISYSVNR